jgi:hypothetical protein
MSTIKILAVFVAISVLLSPAFARNVSAEDVVDKGFGYLLEARSLGSSPFAAATHGSRFDELVKEFYERMAKDGLATPITETFLGEEIAEGNGYRIGRTEVWLRKKFPGSGRSIDILIWELETDSKGKVTGAKAVGMDHHSVHPEAPHATASHKKHWEVKVETARDWEQHVQRQGFKTAIDMHPDNSFYWRDAASARAAEVDEFTRSRNMRAVTRLGSEMGRGTFLATIVPSFGGSMAVLGVADKGVKLLDALKVFYRSPVLERTWALLGAGQYTQARQYWREKCASDSSTHRDCDQLRHALSEASSLLSARTYTDFPDAMMKLFDRWEASAKQAAVAAGLIGVWDATGYFCPNPAPLQTVRITLQGNKLIAVKLKGDDCVPAGQVTWEGTLSGGVISGRGRVSDGPRTTIRWLDGVSIRMVDQDTLEGFYGVTYRRRQ